MQIEKEKNGPGGFTPSYTPGRRGGIRQNAGRPAKVEKLSNYEKAIRLLDDNIEQSLQVIINGLYSKDKNYRLRCSELLLKKALPDKMAIDQKIHAGELKIYFLDDPE